MPCCRKCEFSSNVTAVGWQIQSDRIVSEGLEAMSNLLPRRPTGRASIVNENDVLAGRRVDGSLRISLRSFQYTSLILTFSVDGR